MRMHKGSALVVLALLVGCGGGGEEAPPAEVNIQATDATASEGGVDNGTFTITRTGATTSALSVNISISGTAQNGIDYNTISSPVTIPAGASSQTITVIPVDDTDIEATEDVTITLMPGSGYTIGASSSATVTITDNDAPTIAYSPTVLYPVTIVGNDAPQDTFEIWNSGTGTLNYTVEVGDSWLSCNPISGSSTGEHDAISVTYSTAGLALGRYETLITLAATGATNSPQNLVVQLTVEDPYEDNDASVTAWDFGSDGTGDNVWLSSFGGSMGVQADDDWYLIYVGTLAVGNLVIDCIFTHAEGDIDIELYEAPGDDSDGDGVYGELLAGSYSVTDDEQISYDTYNGHYFVIRVFGENAGNPYDLKWDD